MSLFRSMDIAATAMSAGSVNMNVISSNLANINTVASSPEKAYKEKYPVFKTVYGSSTKGAIPGGVGVAGVVENPDGVKAVYNPSHPMADNKGYVYQSNVNFVEQMTNMIAASRSYQNNVEIAKSAKNLLQQTLSIGQ